MGRPRAARSGAPAEDERPGPLRILAAAAEAIADVGFVNAGVEDIARRAGVTTSAVVSYFGSKDRLLAEALTLLEDRFRLEEFERVRKKGSPRDHLAHLIRATCPSPGSDEELAEWKLWIELWARALRDPEVARKRHTLDRRWRETIASVVRAGQESGDFAAADADEFALRLAAFIDGLAVQVALGDEEVSCDRMLTLVLGAAARELLPAGQSFA